MRRALAGLALLATVVASQPAAASACHDAKYAPIAFAKGQRCWRYQGNATHWTGNFARGQTVVASATGLAGFGDGTWQWERTMVRDLDVTGPGKRYIQIDDQGDGSFVAPVTGRYEFSFSPCAAWHSPGTFIVCAR